MSIQSKFHLRPNDQHGSLFITGLDDYKNQQLRITIGENDQMITVDGKGDLTTLASRDLIGEPLLIETIPESSEQLPEFLYNAVVPQPIVIDLPPAQWIRQ